MEEIASGFLQKLKIHSAVPLCYELIFQDRKLVLNTYLGKNLRFEFTGIIHCVACGRQIKKSFQDGHCFVCQQSLAVTDICSVRPEKCHFTLGTCRDEAYAQSQCFIPHWIYLANTSGVKVGITRHTNVPGRWFDQGAVQALPICVAGHRLMAGLVEIALAQHLPDKTNWRKLLQPQSWVDLERARSLVLNEFLDFQGERLRLSTWPGISMLEEPVSDFTYPIQSYPQKVASLSFDKAPIIQGKLLGMKGQYLFFEQGGLSMRKCRGYELMVSEL